MMVLRGGGGSFERGTTVRGYQSQTAAQPTRVSERLVIYCQTTGVIAAHATHCATYCTPCRPLIPAFSGRIRTPPPTLVFHRDDGVRSETVAKYRKKSRAAKSGRSAVLDQLKSTRQIGVCGATMVALGQGKLSLRQDANL